MPNQIEYVYNIEQMKGHLDQAILNKENGNDTLARGHILHPIVEIYDFIEAPLVTVDSNLNHTLYTSLNELSQDVENLDVSQFTEETEKSNQMLNDAIKLVVPQENSTLNLIVASWLLDVANTEYQAGVNEGKVIEIIEYQDASGFISRAESLVKDSLPMLDQSMKSSAEEILNLISPLKSEVQNKVDIQIPIDELKQKISNMTGI
ncbi:MAG TPA: hypothetical protein VJ772_08960 [Nitrososphaeraceae archaeon]|nr:hypothetical protein [Nitrososphaeraceae archaeon]